MLIYHLWQAEFEPNGPKHFSDVVTGYESWVFFFPIGGKQSNMEWLEDEELWPQILHVQFSRTSVCGCGAPTVHYHSPILHILLHHDHDNASPHKARLNVQYLEQQSISLFPHPPYSPDVTSCDFWLFPKIKAAIIGKQFQRIQDLALTVNSELLSSMAASRNGGGWCNAAWRQQGSPLKEYRLLFLFSFIQSKYVMSLPILPDQFSDRP